MGTQAHWMSYRWRTRTVTVEDGVIEVGAPVYAETLADARSEVSLTADHPAQTVVVERRTGRKVEGYVYVFDRILNPPAPGICRHCGRDVALMEHPRDVVAWGDSTRDPFYCPSAADLTHRAHQHPETCWCGGTGWRKELGVPCNMSRPNGATT